MIIFIWTLFILNLHAKALECSFLSYPELGEELLAAFKNHPFECQKNKVHLTFDDGPLPRVTSEILNEIAKRKIKGTFFISTTRLENHYFQSNNNHLVLQEILAQGHILGNHGHHHHAYDLRMSGSGEILSEGMSEEQISDEINKSEELLNRATHGAFNSQEFKLFRFPYGRGAMPSEAELESMIENKSLYLEGNTYAEKLKNYRQISPALQIAAHSGYSHLGWNHDSGDSSYLAVNDQRTLSDYVLSNIKNLCSKTSSPKVALFHDIKEINLKAIPLLIDLGQCLGLGFISLPELLETPEVLIKTGVLIPVEKTLSAPIESLSRILSGKGTHAIPQECPPGDSKKKTCFSQYTKRYYRHCEGKNSICYEGKWYAASDPIVSGCKKR